MLPYGMMDRIPNAAVLLDTCKYMVRSFHKYTLWECLCLWDLVLVGGEVEDLIKGGETDEGHCHGWKCT